MVCRLKHPEQHDWLKSGLPKNQSYSVSKDSFPRHEHSAMNTYLSVQICVQWCNIRFESSIILLTFGLIVANLMKLLSLLDPLVMFMDFFMGIIVLLFAYQLYQKGKNSNPDSKVFVYSWSLAMLVLALGVTVGGTIEGLKAYSVGQSLTPWKLALGVFAGAACSIQVFGTMHLTLRDSLLRSLLFGAWGGIFTIYVVFLLVFSYPQIKNPFIVWNTLVIIVLFVHYYINSKNRISLEFVLGIAFQSAAILLFFAGFKLPGFLGSSILFDALMMIGLYFYYRGIMGDKIVLPSPFIPSHAT